MNSHISGKSLRIVVLVSFLGCLGVQVLGDYMNPIVDHTSADPYIYQHTDGFYYYVLSMDNGIVVMKNNILSNWRNPVDKQKVYGIPPGQANLWAPEIHFINGQWYIYFTMGTGPIPTQRMWVIEALNPENPLGAYSSATRLLPPTEDFYQIDGTVVQFGNKTDYSLYMMWSGCDIDGIDNPTNIYIAPMSNPKQLAGPRQLLRTRTMAWEGTVLEGPQVIWNGTQLFIVFSANHYTTKDYCLGMMSINNAQDPLVPQNWDQSFNEPVFYLNEAEGVYGPGHASFTYSPDKTELWIAYHAMQVPQMPSDHDNRTTRVERCEWVGDIPVLPRPAGLGIMLNSPSGEDIIA